MVTSLDSSRTSYKALNKDEQSDYFVSDIFAISSVFFVGFNWKSHRDLCKGSDIMAVHGTGHLLLQRNVKRRGEVAE